MAGTGSSGRGFRCLGHGTPEASGDFKPKALAAAEEYRAISATQPVATAKADRLRRSASLYKMGGNAAAAVTTLQEATKLPLPEGAVGPVWAELADALLAADRPAPEVLKAFNEAMAAAGLVSTTTRYRLARQFADGRDPRLAPLSRNSSGRSPSRKWSHDGAGVPRTSSGRVSRTTSSAQPTSRKQRSGCAATRTRIPPARRRPWLDCSWASA